MVGLIKLQEQLIARYAEIESNGVGDHKKRSRSRAARRFVAELVRQGYSEHQALAAEKDARDMWRLKSVCEE